MRARVSQLGLKESVGKALAIYAPLRLVTG
jgi:hypothetical protein